MKYLLKMKNNLNHNKEPSLKITWTEYKRLWLLNNKNKINTK